MSEPTREIFCEDALPWLRRADLTGCSVITSLPDVSEVQLALPEWKEWFVSTAALIIERLPESSVAIFFQTDIKKQGAWIDKGYLVSKAAERAGAETLFHKIACRVAPGTTTFGRPAYSHLLAFSRGVKLDLSRWSPDVLPEVGATTWTRGMGEKACELACRFVMTHTQTRTIVDPFCGHGTVLAVANHLGLSAIGVELSPKRAGKARSLSWPIRRRSSS